MVDGLDIYSPIRLIPPPGLEYRCYAINRREQEAYFFLLSMRKAATATVMGAKAHKHAFSQDRGLLL